MNYTRRKLLRDIGIASASLTATPWASAKRTRSDTPRHTATSSTDLYVILQGPWLFSIDTQYLRAITAHCDSHKYTYTDTLTKPSKPAVNIGTAGPYTLNVTPASGPAKTKAVASTLFDSMKQNYQGIFIATNTNPPISLINPPPSPVHQIQLSYPDALFPMALLSGVSFQNLESVQNRQVIQWPSAIVLQYINWTQATLTDVTNATIDSIGVGASQNHRAFSIHGPASTKPDPCDAASDNAAHTVSYFNQLMTLLSFPPSSPAPIPMFPQCVSGIGIPILTTMGGDGSITGCEVDPTTSDCPIENAKGAPLVNCASGGGIHNCC